MKNMHVKCDLCGWKESVEKIAAFKKWHHAPCPKCSGMEIISDTDIATIVGGIAMEAQMTIDFLLSSDPSAYKEIDIHVDTADGKLTLTEKETA